MIHAVLGIVSGFALGILLDCLQITLRPSVRHDTVGVADYLSCMVIWFSTSSNDSRGVRRSPGCSLRCCRSTTTDLVGDDGNDNHDSERNLLNIRIDIGEVEAV